MTTPISFLSLQQAIESVATKMISNISISNVQYLDNTGNVSNATTTVAGGKLRINGTNFPPGGGTVYFDHQGEVLTKVGVANQISNTQLQIESVPDLGTKDLTLTPFVLSNGGFAIGASTMNYNGTFRFDPTDMYGYKGKAVTFDYSGFVAGSSGNVTYTMTSPDIGGTNITLSPSGTLTANVGTSGDASSRYVLTVTVHDTDLDLQITKTNELRLLGPPRFLESNNPRTTSQYNDLVLDYEGAKTSILLPHYYIRDYTDSSAKGLFYKRYFQLGGSLKGKRIISSAMGHFRGLVDGLDGFRACFFVTDDHHIHGVGAQRGRNALNGTYDAYSGSLGLGIKKYSHQYEANVQYTSTILEPVDFTETYNWPLCKYVCSGNDSGLSFAYVTLDGDMYSWGYCDIVAPYVPFTTYDFINGNQRYLLTPKPVMTFPKDPNIQVGFATEGTYARRWFAWVGSNVYQYGYIAIETFKTSGGGNITSMSGSYTSLLWRPMTNGGWTSGYTSSLAGRTVKTVVGACYNYCTIVWALCTDGTLHNWNTTFASNTDYSNTITDVMNNGMTDHNPWFQCTLNSFAGKTFTKVVAMTNVSFAALDTAGNVHTWGNNQTGEMGRNAAAGTSYTSAIINSLGSLNGKVVVDIVARYNSLWAIDSTGRIHVTGSFGNGAYFPTLTSDLTGTNLLTMTLLPVLDS